MHCVGLIAGLSTIALTCLAAAQDPATRPPDAAALDDDLAATQPDKVPPATQPAQPAFFPLNYSGSWLERSTLTGDWGGLRNQLAEGGVAFNVEVLQFMQGNAYGGRSTDNAVRYFGSADYVLQLDTGRLNLWPGGYFKIRGETEWGHGITGPVGAVAPPNFDALLPAPDRPGLTTLTEYYMMQFLSEKFGLIAGQVDLTRLPGQNVFFTDPYNQFMNTALWQNLGAFAVAPYAAMTAGALYMPTKWLSGATLVVDSFGTPEYSGFQSAFHSPQAVSILQSLTFTIKPCGLEGHQRINFGWSDRERIPLKDLDRLFLAGVVGPSFSRLNFPQSLRVGGRNFRVPHPFIRAAISRVIAPEPTNSDNWAFWYDFDQYLYQCRDDPKQGFGLFGSFGWTPGELFPVSEFYTLGIGGKGVIPGCSGDRYGVGYYYINFSNDIPGLIGVNAEQGVELFYNIEITPWLHITPDLQVIVDPGGTTGAGARNPAIVYGLRMQTSF